MSEIKNYFIEVVAADEETRGDLKSLRESSYQLFKAGYIQDPKGKVRCHSAIIVDIEELHNNKRYFDRPYSFFSLNLPSK